MSLTWTLLLSLLAFSSSCSAADPVHLPIIGTVSSPPSLNQQVQSAQWTRRRYGYPTNFDDEARRRGVVAKRAGGVNQASDISYSVVLNIGTPGQPLPVALDTAFSDLWVWASSCNSGCNHSIPLYDRSKSSTTAATQGAPASRINYGSSTISATLTNDTVQVGQYSAPSQMFLAATQISPNPLDDSVSGVLGLGLAALSTAHASPLWQSLSASGQPILQEMAFWFPSPTSGQSLAGALTLGGWNESLHSTAVEFINMSGSQTYWMLPISNLTVQGTSVPVTGGAVFDTASLLIGGPAAAVQAIWAKVPGASELSSTPGFYGFPCTTAVQLSISFGGSASSIDPANMNLGPVSSGSAQCLGALFALDPDADTATGSNPSWVFGMAFLKNMYTVFRQDPPSIGLAQLSSLALDPSLPVPSPTGSIVPGSSSPPGPSQSKKPPPSPVWPIVGAIFGFAVVILIGVFIFCRRRPRTKTWNLRERLLPPIPSDDVDSTPEIREVEAVPTQAQATTPLTRSLSTMKREQYTSTHRFRDRQFPIPIDTGEVEAPVANYGPPPSTRSLSTMKREQCAAIHRFRDRHSAPDALVQTREGLQLSAGLEPATGRGGGGWAADGEEPPPPTYTNHV